MPQLPVYLVDAFTTTPLAGNACAVVCDAGDLDDETMLAIAREMNLSETAFVLPSDRADVRARYFTPAEEIPSPDIPRSPPCLPWSRLDGWGTKHQVAGMRSNSKPASSQLK